MKLKRVLLAALAAVLASFAFSSCVNEAPEINYVVEYTHNSDFSSIIEAIKSQSTTIAQKLDAVEAAVSEGFMTMEEASSALKEALVESLNNQNATLSDIQQAIVSQNLLLEDKLDVLTAAVNKQTATLQEALDYIDASIQDQTKALKAKLDLINETVETGAANLVEALEAFEETMDEDFQNQTLATNLQTLAMTGIGAAIVQAINNGVATLEEALDAIDQSIDDQTEALALKLDTIASAIEDGVVDLVDALEAFEETMEDAVDGVATSLDLMTTAQGLMTVAIIQAINNGVSSLEDALEAIGDAIDDQTDAIEMQAELIIAALDSGAASIEEVATALSNIYDNINAFESVLGTYYQKIINAILLLAGEEPEEEPLYYIKEGVPGLFMNGAGYEALESAPDARAAYLLKRQQYSVEAPLFEVTATFSFDNSMNYDAFLTINDRNATVNEIVVTDDPDQSYIIYTVEAADEDGEGYKHVLYYETVAKISVTGYSSNNISLSNLLGTHTLVYSTDGGSTWSDKIAHDSEQRVLYGGSAEYTAYIPLDGVTTVNFKYGE